MNTDKLASLRTFVAYCIERDTLLRSIKTGLVVGTILALINHGQDLLSGQFSWGWVIPMLITYLVPFSVATYGQAQGKRQRDLARITRVMPTSPSSQVIDPGAHEV